MNLFSPMLWIALTGWLFLVNFLLKNRNYDIWRWKLLHTNWSPTFTSSIGGEWMVTWGDDALASRLKICWKIRCCFAWNKRVLGLVLPLGINGFSLKAVEVIYHWNAFVGSLSDLIAYNVLGTWYTVVHKRYILNFPWINFLCTIGWE